MVSYYNPTRRLLANGALSQLAEAVQAFQAKRILLVLGKGSFKASSHYLKLMELMAPAQVVECGGIDENPSILYTKDLAARFAGDNIDMVVGVGGGSVMDVAKMAAVLLPNSREALDRFLASKTGFDAEPIPVILLPTTSGTGSEVTPYASLETAEHKKITVTHPFLFPKMALVDPLLTHSMPAGVTASTGFDALSQAIEAFWSVHACPFSDGHALRAVSLIVENLMIAVKEPLHEQARYAMSWAACESGLAIAHTATTAVHSVSYPITTFFGVPHGHACALTLAEFLRFNEPVMRHERYRALWRAMGAASAADAARLVEDLMDQAGLERSLKKLGISETGVETILKNAFRPDRVKNNPRPVTLETIQTILSKIYA